MLAIHKFSKMFPREQRESKGETETERVNVYVLVFRGDLSLSLI